MVLYISCYTDVYEEEAKGLIETLKQFDLPHKVERKESLGSWDLNTKLKANFVQETLNEQDDAVVWLDADARVKQNPVLFNEIQEDFACHIRRGVELLSGTLYFANNDRCKDLVTEWIKINNQRKKAFDQQNLHSIIKRYLPQKLITLKELPPTYCLFDLIIKFEKVMEAPVIWHRQASRRLKKLANGR